MDAWVGVAGTLLGLIVGAAVTYAQDQAKWRREDRHRFAETKRKLYADLFRESRSVGLDLVDRVHQLQRVFEGDLKPDDVRPVARLVKVHDMEEEINVVASDDVYDAANHLLSAMSWFHDIASQDAHSLTASPWDKGDASPMWDAHDAFITAARADLGVGHRPISNA